MCSHQYIHVCITELHTVRSFRLRTKKKFCISGEEEEREERGGEGKWEERRAREREKERERERERESERENRLCQSLPWGIVQHVMGTHRA